MSRGLRELTIDSNGFTLVELLVASLITMAIAAVALTVASQAQRIFDAQPEQSDLQQRIRVAVDALRRDLVMAGGGTYAGPASGTLGDFIAPVMPYRAVGGADPSQGTFFRPDTISILYVPPTAAQSTLAAPLPDGALDVQIAAVPNCPIETATRLCGFEAGSRALVFDKASQWDTFAVEQIGSGIATLRHRGASSTFHFAVGAAISEVRLSTYTIKTDPSSGSSQLVRYDGWSTELPVVDDVVTLKFEYFGAAEPPRLTGLPLDREPGPWTTYGPAPPPIEVARGAWLPGENCTFLVIEGTHVPRLSVLAGGGLALAELTPGSLTDGPWCPDSVSPNRFDADLLRVRKVRVTLRVQSAIASLRGPASALFFKRGSARASDRFVPDLEVQFDVAPRNLNLQR